MSRSLHLNANRQPTSHAIAHHDIYPFSTKAAVLFSVNRKVATVTTDLLVEIFATLVFIFTF